MRDRVHYLTVEVRLTEYYCVVLPDLLGRLLYITTRTSSRVEEIKVHYHVCSKHIKSPNPS
jgi:hypothetical protein